MIPTKDTSRKVTGSLGGETHMMQIAAENVPHLMGILTDLYSDPELAVIREYSTNARDSHIQAGVDLPIKVTLPTPLRQTLEIQDFGLGLSVDEVVNVYGSYGASTKRESNEVNGMLGLGSKSALTYTNMFTVRAVKDGVQAEVVFFRNEDGSGRIEVVDTKGTDNPNGVTISIPTKANSTFKEKALKFYSVWDKGTVEVVGEEISFIKDTANQFDVNGTLLVERINGNGTLYIVMGGVTYPVRDKGGRYYDNYSLYHFADMGAIDFTPSREDINYTDRTQGYVDDLLTATDSRAVEEVIQDKVNQAKSLDAAYDVVDEHTWVGSYQRTYEWKGISLSTAYGFGNQTKVWHPDRTGPSMWERIYRVNLGDAEQYAFVKEFDRFTFIRKAQLRKLLETKYPKVKYVIFGERPKDSFLSVKSKQIPHSKIEKIVIPKSERKTARSVYKVKAEYDIWDSADVRSYALYKAIPDNYRIVYIGSNHASNAQINWLREQTNTCLVRMEYRREEKFLRENPNVERWATIHEQQKAKLPEITEIEQIAFGMRTDWMGRRRDNHTAQWLIDNGFADDTLKEIMAVDLDTVDTKRKTWDNVGINPPSDKAYDYVESVWPLLDYRSHPEHSRLYCEAIQKEGK